MFLHLRIFHLKKVHTLISLSLNDLPLNSSKQASRYDCGTLARRCSRVRRLHGLDTTSTGRPAGMCSGRWLRPASDYHLITLFFFLSAKGVFPLPLRPGGTSVLVAALITLPHLHIFRTCRCGLYFPSC